MQNKKQEVEIVSNISLSISDRELIFKLGKKYGIKSIVGVLRFLVHEAARREGLAAHEEGTE